MKINILSTFNNFLGASIAASTLNKALNNNGLSSNMLVQNKKGNLPKIEIIASKWFQKKWSLIGFALDRFQFTFYEKIKKFDSFFHELKLELM